MLVHTYSPMVSSPGSGSAGTAGSLSAGPSEPPPPTKSRREGATGAPPAKNGERRSRDGCPQPEAPAPAGLSEINLQPGKAGRTAAGPLQAVQQEGPFDSDSFQLLWSLNAPFSFPRSAPTGWAQRLQGPACRLCLRRPTGRRRHSATRLPLPLPPTSSLPTSRRPTRSRHCPMARRPTPPPPFPTWPAIRTAAWRPWHSLSLHRPPGPRPAPLPAQQPAPTTSRPACWRRPPAPWAWTLAATTPLPCPGSCTAWPTARTAWRTRLSASPGWRRRPAWRTYR